jgi:hypothetical protein
MAGSGLKQRRFVSLIGIDEPDQELCKRLWGCVVHAEEMIASRSQKGDGGPAILVVAQVDIRALRLLDANGYEEGVQQRDDLIVGP